MSIVQGVSGAGGGGSGGVDGPALHVYLAADITAYATVSINTVLFDTIQVDTDPTSYNVLTGVYTVPSSGTYLCTCNIVSASGNPHCQTYAVVDGVTGLGDATFVRGGYADTSGILAYSPPLTCLMPLVAGDDVTITLQNWGGTMAPLGLKTSGMAPLGGQNTYWSMVRVTT